MKSENFDCLICGKNIANNRMLSVELCLEHERDGAYDVDFAEFLLVTCESCSIKHDVQNRIDKEAKILVESMQDKNYKTAESQEIFEINSDYDCLVCGQPIQNGSQTLNLSSGYERYANGIITPEFHALHFVACVKCSDEINFKPEIYALTERLISEARRESIREDA